MILLEKRVGEVCVLSVEGRLDATSWESFHDRIIQLLDSEKKTILLDFSKMEYISSLGLRALILAGKKMNSVKGKIAICCVQKAVKEVFEKSGFMSLFPLFDDQDKALQSLS